MSQITLQLEKLTCPSCMKKVTDTVNALSGVERTKVLFEASKARVFFAPSQITDTEIIHTIEDIGYEAQKIK